MRALIVTYRDPPYPYEIRSGVERRLNLFIRAIAHTGAQLEILHLASDEAIKRCRGQTDLDRIQSDTWGAEVQVSLGQRRKVASNTFGFYAPGILRLSGQPRYAPFAGVEQIETVRKALASFPDVVFVHRLMAMAPILRGGLSYRNLLFDLDDVEHRVLLRSSFARPIYPGKLALLTHIPALISAEREASRRAAATFVCAQTDAEVLLKLGLDRVVVVPNAVKIPKLAGNVPKEPTALFLGSFLYEPNVAAARRLTNDIWPSVLKHRPDARLILAGERSDMFRSLSRPPGDWLDCRGYVENLDELYAQSRIVCCPISVGGGTRVKIVEAAAFGKPIVSTTIGAEGTQLSDGTEILIRDGDEEFADACLQLFNDDAACASIGTPARAKAIELYDSDSIEKKIASIVQSLR